MNAFDELLKVNKKIQTKNINNAILIMNKNQFDELLDLNVIELRRNGLFYCWELPIKIDNSIEKIQYEA